MALINKLSAFARLRRPALALVLASTALLGYSAGASAEGRCPPGQHPIGGQGVGGCAPIAQSGAAEGPTPTGKWVKTWGAIAMSSATGDVGVSVAQRSKGEASRLAVANCAVDGASDCKLTYTYKNQCVALVSPASKNETSTVGRGPTKEVAVELATGTCTKRGSQGCSVLYSACSDPVFDRY